MARKMTTKKADTTAKTASMKETPAKSVAAAPVENAVKAETEKTENAKVTAVTVSYTHLDVYKRQTGE